MLRRRHALVEEPAGADPQLELGTRAVLRRPSARALGVIVIDCTLDDLEPRAEARAGPVALDGGCARASRRRESRSGRGGACRRGRPRRAADDAATRATPATRRSSRLSSSPQWTIAGRRRAQVDDHAGAAPAQMQDARRDAFDIDCSCSTLRNPSSLDMDSSTTEVIRRTRVSFRARLHRPMPRSSCQAGSNRDNWERRC